MTAREKKPFNLTTLLPLGVWLLTLAVLTALNIESLGQDPIFRQVFLGGILLIAGLFAYYTMGGQYAVFAFGMSALVIVSGIGVEVNGAELLTLWPVWGVMCLVWFPLRDVVTNWLEKRNKGGSKRKKK